MSLTLLIIIIFFSYFIVIFYFNTQLYDLIIFSK